MARLEDIPPELVAEAVAKAVVEAVNEGGDTDRIVARTLDRARRDLGLGGEPSRPPPEPAPAMRVPPATNPGATRGAAGTYLAAPMGSGKFAAGSAGTRAVVTEGDVLAAARRGEDELRLASGTIVTALARDAARDHGVRLAEG